MTHELRKKRFRPPVCCECAKELTPERATYESAQRLYCDECENLGRAQQSWKPLPNVRIGRMFQIKN